MNIRKIGKRSAIMGALCGAMAMPVFTSSAVADTLELTGVLRDFKRGDWNGGHPDFQTATKSGRGGHGLVSGHTTMDISEDGKPVYNPNRPSKDNIWSEESFNQWYNDTPRVNVSIPHTLVLENGQDKPGGTYSVRFDTDANQFFPLDGQGFGNQSLSHNYHFTFELHTDFSYEPGQQFTFVGDDDVWVYIRGKKVIDIGGTHGKTTAKVILFDGKVFVEKRDFPEGGDVKVVGSTQATNLAKKWSRLGLPGTCPLVEGTRYVNPNLNGASPDMRCEFDGKQVVAYCAKKLMKVTLRFEDGTTQVFEGLNSYGQKFVGTGVAAGKKVIGCWIVNQPKSGQEVGPAQYFSLTNSPWEHPLDFFFAERHTTRSNFRIDTTISLQAKEPATISALYD